MFLVSGATGNVGGELVRALVSACEQVHALTHGDGSPAWQWANAHAMRSAEHQECVRRPTTATPAARSGQ